MPSSSKNHVGGDRHDTNGKAQITKQLRAMGPSKTGHQAMLKSPLEKANKRLIKKSRLASQHNTAKVLKECSGKR
jgi:hypothetical protein